MKKDAYYFSHDSNAKDDPKCMLLIDQLGLEGYGIFWILIETLRDQAEYKYPIKLLPILARRYNTSAEKMIAVVKNYMFFELDQDENFFSLSLNQRMERLEGIREKRRIAGIESGKKRKELAALNTCSTSDEQMLNKNEQSIVKKSIVKDSIIKDKIEKFSFKNSLLNLGVNPDVVETFLKIRKEKKGINSEIAFQAIEREIKKANKPANECIKIAVEKSWAGFEAKWIIPLRDQRDENLPKHKRGMVW